MAAQSIISKHLDITVYDEVLASSWKSLFWNVRGYMFNLPNAQESLAIRRRNFLFKYVYYSNIFTWNCLLTSCNSSSAPLDLNKLIFLYVAKFIIRYFKIICILLNKMYYNVKYRMYKHKCQGSTPSETRALFFRHQMDIGSSHARTSSGTIVKSLSLRQWFLASFSSRDEKLIITDLCVLVLLYSIAPSRLRICIWLHVKTWTVRSQYCTAKFAPPVKQPSMTVQCIGPTVQICFIRPVFRGPKGLYVQGPTTN